MVESNRARRQHQRRLRLAGIDAQGRPLAKHTCAFRPEHDLEKDEPRGPACGKPATQELHWKDGRVSPSCAEHGIKALDPDARKLLKKVTRPVLGRDWLTNG